ncbi:methyl-accepting chemotaxis protein [Solemya pervernicosa gill symbiont]|uniref:Methyl-accepting chemotaxis protein n=2 Tax=Gammaproteobacteria incertae sedis TaxID=118884 RepID=A0A1T2L9G1_9GAMM|nr:methyl-accepting chemotaxis protein [Solemya pervernicosa gill symbiont]OOZ41745.1 methyl-accepting chemotaxis protein [Solemya pervernicosa gill symbiont]
MKIAAKINLTLLAVFVTVLIASLWHSFKSTHSLVESAITQQTTDMADSYFDTINAMMLTGNMTNRQILQKKLLERPNVLEARIIRGEGIAKLFGAGFEDQKPVDELDRRALAGEAVIEDVDGEEGSYLTVVTPLRASADYRGTNCLLCHQVPEGTVLGAVRVSYSLDEMHNKIFNGLLSSGGIQIVLFAAGLVLMVYMLGRVVTKPINKLRGTIQSIEQNSDLSQQIVVEKRDEIGEMADAFNGMIVKFHDSLKEVSDTTHGLTDVADRIRSTSEQSAGAVREQQTGTEMVATAMNEMEATVQEVARNAGQTAELSKDADQEAKKGAYVVTQAIGGIDILMSDVEQASTVIKQLDEKSENVGVVLDVIKGIAEQTNLLALNAAIEAARAGEQGRGFAVVADEVRTLATRTHQSTQEIEQMIEELQLGAREAVSAMETARGCAAKESEQVEAAAESLAMIAGGVSGINDMNSQIAIAADEQSKVAEDINRNIVNISQLAEQASQLSGQNAEVSNELIDLSAKLNMLVDRFRL